MNCNVQASKRYKGKNTKKKAEDHKAMSYDTMRLQSSSDTIKH